MIHRTISEVWSSTAAGAALAGLLFAGTAVAQSRQSEQHFPVEGKPLVTVTNLTNLGGRIQVKAWDRHEVMVISPSASGNFALDTEQSGNRIEIATRDTGGPPPPAGFKADFQINVPVETELQVRTDSGNVTVDSVHGDMFFDTVAADLALQDVQGYLVIRSIAGSLLCTRCAGKLDASSNSGSFQLVQPEMDDVRVWTTAGNILFDGSFQNRGIYVLRNGTGTIEVRFSPNDSFDVNAASLFGNVINQAPVVPDKHGASAPSNIGMARSLFGSLNEGHAKVELSSFSGTIKILKRE